MLHIAYLDYMDPHYIDIIWTSPSSLSASACIKKHSHNISLLIKQLFSKQDCSLNCEELIFKFNYQHRY